MKGVKYAPVTTVASKTGATGPGAESVPLQDLSSTSYDPVYPPSKSSRSWNPLRNLKGWRAGVALCSLTTTIVLAINVLVTAIFATRFNGDTVDGIGTLIEGDCPAVESWSLWLHIIINILGSLMLSASNYVTQVLVAPTRKELDKAHRKGKSLDIGIWSVRNLFGRVSDLRILGILILLVSSIPIHLIFNSAVFKSIDANIYDIVVADETYLTGATINTNVTVYNGGTTYGSNFYGNATRSRIIRQGVGINYNQLVDIQKWWVDNAANTSAVRRLENNECRVAYAKDFVTGYGDVFLGSSERLPADKPEDILYFYSNSAPQDAYNNPTGWICAGRSWLGPLRCSPDPNDTSEWRVNNRRIDYCLTRITPSRCKLQYSVQILMAVCICNAVKLAIMIATFFIKKHSAIVTLGDAISTYLQIPDTSEKCHDPLPPPPTTLRQRRWYHGVSLTRWVITTLLILTGIAISAYYLNEGIKWSNDTAGGPTTTILSRGFGRLDPAAVIGSGAPLRGTDGLIRTVFLANTPQLVCSILYLMYNGLFTSMCAAAEWSAWYMRPKALRTSEPKGKQRNTYWLQLPFRYSVPLLGMSILLHWLISQSLFLARVVVYADGRPVDPVGREASRLGYSCLPIVIVIVVAVLLLLGAMLMGLRKLDGRMPVVRSDSALIARACHAPREDVDGALSPLCWARVEGIPPWSINGQVTTWCCFTSFLVRQE